MAAAVAISGAYFSLVFCFNHWVFLFSFVAITTNILYTDTHGLEQLQLNGCAYFMRKITFVVASVGFFVHSFGSCFSTLCILYSI